MIIRGVLALVLILASPLLRAFEEEKFAHALGLELVSEGHPYNFLGVHTMYANETLSRQLLLMRDVPAALPELRIIRAKGYLILEIPKSASTYYSMALVGITEEEIRRNLAPTTVWRKLWNELTPLPRAYGVEDCSGIEGRPTARGLEQLQAFYGSSFVQGSFRCISNFLQGIWGSTGGRVGDLVDGIRNLVTDPRAFWDRRVQEVRNLERFIANFDSRIKSMASSIAQLPTETKVHMLCGFLGGLGADAVIAILAGGAGVGQLLFRAEEYIRRLTTLDRVFLMLQQAGKLTHIPPDFFQRLATSRVPILLVDTLNKLATRYLPDLVTGVMECIF
jgi:hypothetical protein